MQRRNFLKALLLAPFARWLRAAPASSAMPLQKGIGAGAVLVGGGRIRVPMLFSRDRVDCLDLTQWVHFPPLRAGDEIFIPFPEGVVGVPTEEDPCT